MRASQPFSSRRVGVAPPPPGLTFTTVRPAIWLRLRQPGWPPRGCSPSSVSLMSPLIFFHFPSSSHFGIHLLPSLVSEGRSHGNWLKDFSFPKRLPLCYKFWDVLFSFFFPSKYAGFPFRLAPRPESYCQVLFSGHLPEAFSRYGAAADSLLKCIVTRERVM